MAERIAVELERKELAALAEFWLREARAYKHLGNKEKAGQAFERAQRMGDLRHEVN